MTSAASTKQLLLWLAFVWVYLMAYFLSTVLPTPLLWYEPLRHRFVFQVRESGLGMDFYGRVLFSLISGGSGWLAMRIILGFMPRLARGEVARALIVWVMGLLLFTGALYVSLLWHRNPVPLAMPQIEADAPR